MTIKAIETQYKGYRFRSRLEARWAVFFDAIEVKWEYEKEGFDLEGTYYLPDFYLADSRLWIEIKPELPTSDDARKLFAFAKQTTDQLLLLNGQPWPGEYSGVFWRETKSGVVEKPEVITALAFCRRCNALFWIRETQDDFAGGSIGKCCDSDRYPVVDCKFARHAYDRARSARFEHGETPE